MRTWPAAVVDGRQRARKPGLHGAGERMLRERILRQAERMVGRRALALAWFFEDPIRRCDGMTAAELLARGRGRQVLSFLSAVQAAECRVRR
jgi:hypothetical protein